MSATVTEAAVKKPGFFDSLVGGDEMAFIALVVTGAGIVALLCVVVMEMHAVIIQRVPFNPLEFCQAVALLLGGLVTSLGTLAGFMGLKSKLGG